MKNLVKKVTFLGKEYKVSESNQKEIATFIDSLNEYAGKNATFNQLLSFAKSRREAYGLKSFEALAKGTQNNYINRLARFVGSTVEKAVINRTYQSVVFNVEVRTGVKIWGAKIDQNRPISPQVKELGSVKIPAKQYKLATYSFDTKKAKARISKAVKK